MTFPYYFHLFGARVHPHALMELIAYTGGFQLYLYLRRRDARPAVPFERNMWIIVGCVFGALIGSKLLAWIESAPDYWPHRFEPQAWLGGKTIVGGLLGGWAGVEISKRLLHVTRSTGDLFVYPLILGQCIGRVGCFLTGLPDHTYGNHTRVPWSVDFGDGPRHPTQLYEILFLLLLGCGIWLLERAARRFMNERGTSLTLSRYAGRGQGEGQRHPVSRVRNLTSRQESPHALTPTLSRRTGRGGKGLWPTKWLATSHHGIATSSSSPFRGGVRFRLYMLGYLLFRFCIEFIKPVFAPYGGLSAIQLASLCGAVVCLTHLLTGRGLDSDDATHATQEGDLQGPILEVTG